ncbi:MAG TPA: DUF58 domain-containing protein, partial [Pseudoxanthomonas sp.]|nr:DUF58 domain-containing protein [Pseudoxanthomonas sp.]
MRPAPLLIALLVLWGLSGLAVPFLQMPLESWQVAGAALALLIVVDLLWLRRRPTPVATREISEALPLGIEREVQLRLESAGLRQRLDVFDLHPGGWMSQGLPQRLTLATGTASTFSYCLRPNERGDAVFAGIQLRL